MVARRAFVRSALTAALANAVSSFAHAAPRTSDTALLILDFQVGIGDQPYAKTAAQRAAAALKAGRATGLPVVFSKVNFRPGYRDIARAAPVTSNAREECHLAGRRPAYKPVRTI
jgi:nicotinamidase-related amidase